MDCAFFEGWLNNCGTADYNWRIYVSAQTAGLHSLYSYTQLLASSTAAFSGPLGLSLGGWVTAENSASEIAELIVYNRVLTESERTQVVMYLNQRYGIYGY
jgi:hypothetical protein